MLIIRLLNLNLKLYFIFIIIIIIFDKKWQTLSNKRVVKGTGNNCGALIIMA